MTESKELTPYYQNYFGAVDSFVATGSGVLLGVGTWCLINGINSGGGAFLLMEGVMVGVVGGGNILSRKLKSFTEDQVAKIK